MLIYEEIQTQFTPWTTEEFMVFLLVLAVEIMILSVLLKKQKVGIIQSVAVVIETIFIALIYGTTVFTRVSTGLRQYELMPGWSWRYIWQYSDKLLLRENIMNMFMLFPVGFMMPFIFFKKIKSGWALLLGFCFSTFIEVSQLVLCRGLFEWDDMIHNSLGCLVGCICGNVILGCIREHT